MAVLANFSQNEGYVFSLSNQIILVDDETGQVLVQSQHDTIHRVMCSILMFQPARGDGDTLTICFCLQFNYFSLGTCLL